MKKNFLWVGLLALGMVALQGCCKKDSEVADYTADPNFDDKMEELTPSKSKTRLQVAGLEFVNTIKAETHENLVDVVAYMDEADFDEFGIDEDYIEKLEALYTETGGGDYYATVRKANPVAAIQRLMSMSLDAAQNGAQLATRADDICMYALKAGLKDLYGGFKPNTKRGVWTFDESVTDRLEVEFTDDHNQTWVATLKGSKETTRIHMTGEDIYSYKWISSWNDEEYEDGYHDQYDVSIDVPKVITFVVKCNEEKIVDMTVNSSLAFEVDWLDDYSSYVNYKEDIYEYDYEFELSVDYTNLNFDATLNVNGYAESWKAEASKSGIKTTGEVKIDGKSMLKAEAALNADVEGIIKQINDANNAEDDVEFDPKDVKNFSMYLDVMGKVQVVGKCNSFKKLYDAIALTEEEAEEKYGDMEVEEAWLEYMDGINKTYSITVHYDNTETVQANIELEGRIEEDEYYDETYCYATPVLVFAADESRYSFEDYFTESSFSDLIEAVEDLGDDFEKLFDRYF